MSVYIMDVGPSNLWKCAFWFHNCKRKRSDSLLTFETLFGTNTTGKSINPSAKGIQSIWFCYGFTRKQIKSTYPCSLKVGILKINK